MTSIKSPSEAHSRFDAPYNNVALGYWYAQGVLMFRNLVSVAGVVLQKEIKLSHETQQANIQSYIRTYVLYRG